MAQKLTKLQAVNIILSNVGQAPVTSINAPNPMVSVAVGILDEVTAALQSEGWTFNTEHEYPFTPDTSKHISIPDNVLALDLPESDERLPIIRGGKLYDKASHTFEWDGTVYANVTWLFDFEDLPEVFKQYAAIRGANLFAGRAVGSVEVVKYSEREEAAARAACIEYETQQGDYNMLGNAFGNKHYSSYLPINVITRR